MCGSTTTLGSRRSRSGTCGSCSNVQPCPSERSALQGLDERLLVDDRPSRGVHQDRRGLHAHKLGIGDQMPGLAGQGQCSDTTSLDSRRSCRGTRTIPSAAACVAAREEWAATTVMPNAAARRATARPLRPRPHHPQLSAGTDVQADENVGAQVHCRRPRGDVWPRPHRPRRREPPSSRRGIAVVHRETTDDRPQQLHRLVRQRRNTTTTEPCTCPAEPMASTRPGRSRAGESSSRRHGPQSNCTRGSR